MKISYKWLSEYVIGRLPPPQKLAELLTMHSFEVESVEKIGEDFVLDVKVLPNRAHDCLSHIGIARESCVILKSKVKSQKSKVKESKKQKISDFLKVEVMEPKLCARYTSRAMFGVKVGPSPKWLKERLEVLGQRSINNIVDATNYAMLALGQPVHAFDLDKIESANSKSKTAKIIVRKAKKNEKIITLDNQEIKLDESILVIADEAEPLAIAGVKGGKKAEVSAETKNIILESACFNSASVRQASKKIGLRTDASARFENGISPALAPLALDYTASLIQQLAGGEIAKGAIDTNPKAHSQISVFFNPLSINKLIGADVPEKEMLDILKRLGFSITKAATRERNPRTQRVEQSSYDGRERSSRRMTAKKNGYLACVPGERLDMETEADIAEEIVRIYGLEKISASLPEESLALPKTNNEYMFAGKIRNILAGCGFSEAYNRSFIGERQARDSGIDYQKLATVANPISEEQKYLRPFLILNLLSNVSENMKHRKEARLFELGNVFSLDDKKISEYTNIGGIVSYKRESGNPRTQRAEPRLGESLAGLRFVHQSQSSWTKREQSSYDGKDSANIFYELKGVVDMLFEQLGIDNVLYEPDVLSEHFWYSGRSAFIKIGNNKDYLGKIGEISPVLLEKISIKERTAAFELDFNKLLELAKEKIIYRPISKFPAVERDIAIVVPAEVKVDDAQAVIENAGGELLSDSELFDIYKVENLEAERKSLAFHLIFQSSERTLTDNEINGIIGKIMNAVEGEGWEVRK